MVSIPVYQRKQHFQMHRTKTVGNVQYFTLKYQGSIRRYIGWSNVHLPEVFVFLFVMYLFAVLASCLEQVLFM